ncbi:MAG: NAD(P)H-binding protein [Campylobacterales bacterium]|nr:NAD(P)H-binding protein [Campylobacterales bacterium]
MKKALIVGATGMVGGIILKEALENEEFEKVVSISRRPSGCKNEKLEEIIHDDYLDYSEIEDCFKDIDVGYFCIGVYTGAVKREEFRKITVDFTKVFADILKKNSPDASFIFLSGQGADRSEKSKMMFAKDKGIGENYLINKNFKSLAIFRPGYIYPVIPREEPNFSYKIFRKIYPFLNLVVPNASVASEHLAKVMIEVGLRGDEKETFENRDIREYRV